MTGKRPDDEALLLAAHFEALRPRERIHLLRVVPSYEEMRVLDHGDLEMIIGRPLHNLRWEPKRLEQRIERDGRWLSFGSRRLLWVEDPEYPELLREIYDPPATLFVRGAVDAIDRITVGVVGTRRPDRTGIGAAHEVGERLARGGFTVASGLAYGIDAAAHRGTVAAHGTAVAVLASGIDAVYPRGNRDLAAAILDTGGAVVSEYAPGTEAQKFHFPARNRIIVGLSVAMLIVEAPESSGALISADFALGENRDLYVHQAGASWAGTARLTSEGAPVVAHGAELIERIGAPRIDRPAPLEPTRTVPAEKQRSDRGRRKQPKTYRSDGEQQKLALFAPMYAELDDRAMRYRLAMQQEENNR